MKRFTALLFRTENDASKSLNNYYFQNGEIKQTHAQKNLKNPVTSWIDLCIEVDY